MNANKQLLKNQTQIKNLKPSSQNALQLKITQDRKGNVVFSDQTAKPAPLRAQKEKEEVAQNPPLVGKGSGYDRGRGPVRAPPNQRPNNPKRIVKPLSQIGSKKPLLLGKENVDPLSHFASVKTHTFSVLEAKQKYKQLKLKSKRETGMRAGLAQGDVIHGVDLQAHVDGNLNSECKMEGCDFLTPIICPANTKAGTILFKVDLTPHAFGRTRISGMANFFTRVELREMTFLYETTQPATQPGAVALVVIQDPDLELPNDINILREVATQTSFVQVPVWMNGACQVTLLDKNDPKYTALLNTDPRVSQFGSLYIIAASDINTGGSGDITLGNLLFGYKLRFENPLLTLTPVGGSYAEFHKNQTTTANHPLGDPFAPVGNLDIGHYLTTGGNTFTVPPGFYHITYFFASTQTLLGTVIQTLGSAVNIVTDTIHKTNIQRDLLFTNNAAANAICWISDFWIQVVSAPASSRTIAWYVEVASGSWGSVTPATANSDYYPYVRFEAISNDIATATYYQTPSDVIQELNVLKQQMTNIMNNNDKNLEYDDERQ